MTPVVIRTKLLEAGVKNLREFGYPNVTTDNILTEYIYAKFFEKMLEDNLGKSNTAVDAVISELMDEVKKNTAPVEEVADPLKPRLRRKADRRKKARR